MTRSRLHSIASVALLVGAAQALLVAACKSDDTGAATTPDASSPSDEAGSQADAADASTPPADAAHDVALLDATCDARIVECTATPTQPSPTVNEPAACGAPAYDSYATPDSNEQVEAACNDFCAMANPAYAGEGGFIGCNQTTAEQALGTGAFHCVCAP